MLQWSLFMPESDWHAPAKLFEIPKGEPISLDLETRDPHLKKMGPSWRFHEGYIVGVAIATADREWYYPIKHQCGNNMDWTVVTRFVQDLLTPDRTVYMANAAYDLGWLRYHRILPDNPWIYPKIIDIQLTEALICECDPRGYSLDRLCQTYLGKKKDNTLLEEAAAALGVDPKADLWRMPPEYVGPYGEFDARGTFDVAIEQEPLIRRDNLEKVFEVEQGLIPAIHESTVRGIPFNIEKAQQLNEKLQIEEDKKSLGFDIWSGPAVASALVKAGYSVPRTDKGNPSVDKSVLQELSTRDDDLPGRIIKAKTLNRLREVYVEDACRWAVNGRIHPEFRQLANDEGGTRSGRMAAANPNIQQVPSRHPIGQEIRSLYHTGSRDIQWGKFDFSSQEPRFQVHYGLLLGLAGAVEIRDEFHNGRKLYDFMVERIPGIDYSYAKILVLARSYRMEARSAGKLLGSSEEFARKLLGDFDDAVPYISILSDRAEASAEEKGYIRTILGRRSRFLYWEPAGRGRQDAVFGLGAARKKWPNTKLKRAFTRNAFNRLIQGSSADQVKVAYLNIFRELKKVMYSQVHDELNFPIISPTEPELICQFMEQAIPDLLIDFKVDVDIGETWK